MSWQVSKAWSDRFMPEIQSILGQQLIRVSEGLDDMQRNTDLITLAMPGQIRIACRVRKYAYLKEYSGEFTVRCRTVHGGRPELHKLLEGWPVTCCFTDSPIRKKRSWRPGFWGISTCFANGRTRFGNATRIGQAYWNGIEMEPNSDRSIWQACHPSSC